MRPGLLWMAGPDQRHEWFNPAWESYTGRTQDELRGERWLELLHAEDVERCRGIMAASFEARQAYMLDYRLRRHDGQYRWILDSGMPRFEADGAWAGYVGSGLDIDERKQAEEQLAERVRVLRVAERRQGAFLSMLSHELRNPLAPIANAASVLRSLEKTNPVLVRLREILERQVDRLERLVENLVDATRSAQGQISLVSEPIAIDSVVRGAVGSSAATLEPARPLARRAVADRRERLGQGRSGASGASALECHRERRQVHPRGRRHRCACKRSTTGSRSA